MYASYEGECPCLYTRVLRDDGVRLLTYSQKGRKDFVLRMTNWLGLPGTVPVLILRAMSWGNMMVGHPVCTLPETFLKVGVLSQ